MSAVATVPSCAPSIDPADHLGLVGHILKQVHFPEWVDREELQAEGYAALVRAARLYDPERGNWSSYACKAIKHGMLNALVRYRRHGRMFSEMEGISQDGEMIDFAVSIPAPEDDTPDPEEVAALLDRLSDREREVIDLRYGLKDRKPKTMEQAGELLGISRGRVQQIEARALERLRSE